jgi:urease accessory protein
LYETSYDRQSGTAVLDVPIARGYQPLTREIAMNIPFTVIARYALFAAILIGASTAQAHTGHGTSGLYEGLVHPFGLDHLLAMTAVGVWSVSALPSHKAWWGPVTFMLALTAGALLGVAGVHVPFLENLIAMSVVLFGVMLIASRMRLPTKLGLGLIAVAASFHGIAHGAETPEAGFAMYALGFLLTTAVLHFGGVLAGMSIRRVFADKNSWAFTMLGVGCSGAGMYLLSQL